MTLDPAQTVWESLPPELLSRFFIDGGWRVPDSDALCDIVSPSTGQPVLSLPAGQVADMEAAVGSARLAFDKGPWRQMTYQERGLVLRKIARQLRDLGDLPSRLYTAQVAAPIGFASVMAGAGADCFELYADLAEMLPNSETRAMAYGRAEVFYEPCGVAAVITPWNAPLALFSMSVAAALLAGCSVVSKPSPEAPLDALLVAWCAANAGLPPGVLNVVTGGRNAGDFLVRDPRVDKISFTGSSAVGKQIAGIAADRMARVTLELGGKSAAIILPDADIGQAFEHIVPWSMPFSGQICFALTRLLVPRNRAEEITSAYIDAVRSIKLGDPWDATTQMGPVVSAKQRDRILNYIEQGRAQGASLLTGGVSPAKFSSGFFIEPTVFGNVHPGMTIAQEEIFGPLVSIISYEDEEDAIRIANDTKYGLNGAVFAKDAERAMRTAMRIRSGSVSVNTMNIQVAAPIGGFKESGIGRVGGIEGLRSFEETKAIYS